MILCGRLEIVVHLSRLKYIENLGPGTFRLCIRVYNKSFGKTSVAIPYVIKHTHEDSDNEDTTESAQIFGDSEGYLSKTFYSPGGEGEIEMNEIAVFRMEIPAYPSYMNLMCLFVDYELLYLDEKNSVCKNLKFWKEKEVEDNKIGVNSKVIRIGSIMKGVSDYVPCTFETGNMHSVLHSSVHCYAIDFCFKVWNPNFVDFQDSTKYQFWNEKLGRKVKCNIRPIHKWFNANYNDDFLTNKIPCTERPYCMKKTENVIAPDATNGSQILSANIDIFINNLLELIIEDDGYRDVIVNLPNNQTIPSEPSPNADKEYGSFDNNIKRIYESYKKTLSSNSLLHSCAIRLLYFLYSKILVMNFYCIGKMIRYLKDEMKKNEMTNMKNYRSYKNVDNSSSNLRDYWKRTSDQSVATSQKNNEIEDKLGLLENSSVIEITDTIKIAEIIEEHDITFDISFENHELTSFVKKRFEYLAKSLGITKINNHDICIRIDDKFCIKFPDIAIEAKYGGSIDKLCEAIGKNLLNFRSSLHLLWGRFSDYYLFVSANYIYCKDYWLRKEVFLRSIIERELTDIQLISSLSKRGITDELEFFLADCYPCVKIENIKGVDTLQTHKYDMDLIHFVVVVHGYGASHYCVRAYRGNILTMFHDCRCDLSEANHKDTKCILSKVNHTIFLAKIQQLARLLAMEVNHRIKYNIGEDKLGRLTFIGHSMGGIIIRKALQEIKYKEKLYALITISTPHIGYPRYMRSIIGKILDWGRSASLKDISMKDVEDRRESLIYQLSKDKEISNFKKIVLVGIKEDYQAFLYSALINATKLMPRSKIGCEMEKNIMDNIKHCDITKIEFSYGKIGHYLDGCCKNRWYNAHNDVILNRVVVRLILAINSHLF